MDFENPIHTIHSHSQEMTPTIIYYLFVVKSQFKVKFFIRIDAASTDLSAR